MVIIVKKRILILVLLSFMITGVVSAASLWGSYKGNAVVRVKVDGQVNKPLGVPAIMYNGQLMVPSRLLTKIGVPFSFDQKKLTLDVKTQKPAQSADVLELQDRARIADFYNRSQTMGDMINSMSTVLSLTYQGISIGEGRSQFDKSAQRYNDVIDRYNSLVKARDAMSSQGLNMSGSQEIFNNYEESLDYYHVALEAMDQFLQTSADHDFDVYIDNAANGFDSAADGGQQSYDNYSLHMSAIINN